ncbi:hypothetical protein BVC80_907g8 [Macleaya cordata]|uniref:RNase H type-1 domain-containing protein n=1 Tax=Macleaya cordata TaxID=56857 RepID=A0A200QEQ2_MACCD|nr:hypothetical protein BVC80_907g8 [Macleaya cordata]
MSDKHMGIGFLCCNHAGGFIGARSISCHAGSAEECEGLALLEAMKWAISKDLKDVIFEGDS